MTISRRAPTAKSMRTYFSDIGFHLRHRVANVGVSERWWLADGEGNMYEMPGGTTESGEAGGGFFRTSHRLWRGWARMLPVFEREARCVGLLAEHLEQASPGERAHIHQWLASEGECFADESNGQVLDMDGQPVDETAWPWSAMRFSYETGQLESGGKPWDSHPVEQTDVWDTLRRADWADQAQTLSAFDVRHPALYFAAVRAVLEPGSGSDPTRGTETMTHQANGCNG